MPFREHYASGLAIRGTGRFAYALHVISAELVSPRYAACKSTCSHRIAGFVRRIRPGKSAKVAYSVVPLSVLSA